MADFSHGQSKRINGLLLHLILKEVAVVLKEALLAENVQNSGDPSAVRTRPMGCVPFPEAGLVEEMVAL